MNDYVMSRLAKDRQQELAREAARSRLARRAATDRPAADGHERRHPVRRGIGLLLRRSPA